ncbi:MAG: hypothetical protein KBG54_04855, partial [Oscillospiraceae bacterium]|nr:hypothetical protein [Oscillospiraceae bacterium]
FASYFIVFVLRVINTRGLIKIHFGFGRMAINLALICASGGLMLKEVPFWPLWCTLLTILIVVYNMGNLWSTAAKLLGLDKKKK